MPLGFTVLDGSRPNTNMHKQTISFQYVGVGWAGFFLYSLYLKTSKQEPTFGDHDGLVFAPSRIILLFKET